MGLETHLVGHIIEDVDVRLPKIVQGDVQCVKGTTVKDVRRFGKGLVIDLDNDYSLAFHIKLTGQIVYRDPDVIKTHPISKKMIGEELPNKGTHVIFRLDGDAALYYNDLRQFGWIKIIKTDELKKIVFFKELGPEPPIGQKDSGQGFINNEKFAAILKKSGISIKPLLLDQKRMGGVGNIYANDGLWEAKIDPKRKANTLSDDEAEKLYNALLLVLQEGFKYGGASELRFVNALGQEGKYQEHFRVYAQQGKPCKRCETKIKKEYVGGRGTFYCPSCQK